MKPIKAKTKKILEMSYIVTISVIALGAMATAIAVPLALDHQNTEINKEG